MAKYRISFLTGLATGFVLGARAGRERYEQIKKAARNVAEHPAVQQAAGAVQAQATGLASAAGSRISDEVRDKAPQLARSARSATARVTERVPGLRGKDGAGATPGRTTRRVTAATATGRRATAAPRRATEPWARPAVRTGPLPESNATSHPRPWPATSGHVAGSLRRLRADPVAARQASAGQTSAGQARYSRSIWARLGWRSLARVLDSIWRIRSRVTPNSWPTSSRVRG